MNLDSIPLFAALGERMKWLTARQKVLSQNVANANTPNYRSRDLKPLTFKEMLFRAADHKMAAKRTDAHHIATDDGSKFKVEYKKDTADATPTGNAVDLEDEMMKVAETQIQYQLTTSLYKKNLGMLKTALGRR
ncbi:MAG: flagellar basal body rod protein FlgB [Alphaproteobacteria bacterium]|nr:MAG: flagellar basal body rod protein FlgB [Alphaproteobacteria bacterium]